MPRTELDFPNDEPIKRVSSDLADAYPERGSVECFGQDFINELRYLKSEGRHVHTVHLKGTAKYRLDFYTPYTPDKNNSEKSCVQNEFPVFSTKLKT